MGNFFVYIFIFILLVICGLLIQILSQLKYLTGIVYKILNNLSQVDNIDENVSDIKKKLIPMNEKLRNVQNILSADRADRLGHTQIEEDY